MIECDKVSNINFLKMSPEQKTLSSIETASSLPDENQTFTFREFCNYTTLHGYNHLYISNKLIIKIFWILAIIATTGISIGFLVDNTDEYIKSRLVTNVESYSANLSVSCFY